MNNEPIPSQTPSTERPATERVAEANAYREGKRAGKQLIGSPIVSIDRGEEIGRIHDVIFNPAQGRLVGVTVAVKGGLLGGGKTLMLRSEDFHAIGEDAITVQSREAMQTVDRPVSEFVEELGQTVLGKRLMTEGGDILGKIDDVLIDRESRRIDACKVSGGLWHDLMRGQTDVPIDAILSIGPDVVVVPQAVREKVEEVSGGLIGTAQMAGEKLTEAKDVAVEKTGQFVAVAEEKIEEIRTVAAERIEDKETEYAVGKVAGADVALDDGTPIVRQGETITQAHVQQAIAAEKLHTLAASAGKSQAADLYDAAKEKTASALETAKQKASEGVEMVKDEQGDLLVGKVAGRDVRAEDGAVVVRGGTTVSEADVARARAQGSLSDLTAAVGVQALDRAKDAVVDGYDETKRNVSDEAASHREPAREEGTTVIHADKVVVEPSGSAPSTATTLLGESVERKGSLY